MANLVLMLCLRLMGVGLGLQRLLFDRLVRVRCVWSGIGKMVAIEDMNLGTADATAINPFDPQLCPQTMRGSCVLQHLGWNTGVDQRSEQHVARDSGKTIDVGNAHK